MNKVKLPKEVAEAIETLRSHDFNVTNHDILFIYAESYNNGYPALVKFNQSHFDVLLQALVNGYEVEETPKDKVREQYNSPKHFYDADNDTDISVYRKGIKFALDTLNIKIEGVNT